MFGLPNSTVGLAEAASPWAGEDVGESIHITSREADEALVFVLRRDGTAHTELNMVRAPNGGWYTNTFSSCPGDAPGVE